MKRKRRSAQRASTGDAPAVFGAGLIALDLVISAEPDVPIRAWAGGTCGNVLAILSFLGWDAYPIARLSTDAASMKVKADLARWGVHLDYAECGPAADTPIIVQEIRRSANGQPTHRFRWACPHCGHWLPGYRPVTLRGAESVRSHLGVGSVFFMDRLSPAALELANEAAERGAVVFFEPSARSDSRLLEAAFSVAHVVKYADQRMDLQTTARPGPSVLLEIKTMGTRGLRYRSWLPQAKTRGWEHLPSIKAPVIADTCGAGDWCSAGILATLTQDGQEGLSEVNTSQLQRFLRYGQVLAAWSCGFEGARGGMYAIDRATFDKQIQQISKGATGGRSRSLTAAGEAFALVPCPACPAAS
jgi:sugar/nucleoside kinase (ribokinase family)